MPSYKTQELANALGVTAQTVRSAVKILGITPEKVPNGKSFVFTQEQAEQVAKQLGRTIGKPKQAKQDNTRQAREYAEMLLSVYEKELEECRKTIEGMREQMAAKDAVIADLSESNKALSQGIAAEKAQATIALVEQSKPSRWQRLKKAWRGQ